LLCGRSNILFVSVLGLSFWFGVKGLGLIISPIH
jgi:hypothetical protein